MNDNYLKKRTPQERLIIAKTLLETVLDDMRFAQKAQLSGEDATKDATSDLIRRQDAIDALQKEINKGIPPFDDVMSSIRCGVRLARNIIEDLPSAEPETASNGSITSMNTEKMHVRTTDDCIRRQDVLHELDGCDYELKDWQRWKLKTMVRDIPSAEPERKKGKWIHDNPNTFRCSRCNKYLDISCGNMKMNFCPNCGADMRGEEE